MAAVQRGRSLYRYPNDCQDRPAPRLPLGGGMLFIRSDNWVDRITYPGWCRPWSAGSSGACGRTCRTCGGIFRDFLVRRIKAKGQFVFPHRAAEFRDLQAGVREVHMRFDRSRIQFDRPFELSDRLRRISYARGRRRRGSASPGRCRAGRSIVRAGRLHDRVGRADEMLTEIEIAHPAIRIQAPSCASRAFRCFANAWFGRTRRSRVRCRRSHRWRSRLLAI